MDQLRLMGPVVLTGILKSLDGYSASESGAIAHIKCTLFGKPFEIDIIGLVYNF